jgi:DNA-3-methyladenine glycosylase I
VADYKTIFEAIESTLFGQSSFSLGQIDAYLGPREQLEGRKFGDDECYRILVHVIFYAGFRAATVTKKLDVINERFPSYRVVAEYGDREIQNILDDKRMIRNKRRVVACVENARLFVQTIRSHGSFQSYIDSFGPPSSDENLLRLAETLQERFSGLGRINVWHFLMDIGMPVAKPDLVLTRTFNRLGLAAKGAEPWDVIREARNFAKATGRPIRYVDAIFVAHGQVKFPQLGVDQGICLRVPRCTVCKAATYCSYCPEHHAAA